MAYNQPQEQPGLIPTNPTPQPSRPYEPKFGDGGYGQPPSAYTANTGYQYPPTIDDSNWKRHRICGLAATTFWLLLALIVVIIAAAVGGGVGGSLAVNNAKTQCLQSSAALAQTQSSTSAIASTSSTSPSSTATPTTTSSSSSSSLPTGTTAWGPLATETPFTGCPGNNNTVYTSTISGDKFQLVCGLDIPFTGSSDLLYAITPTFELCMELCASWNSQGKSNGNVTVPCKGIAFIATHVNGDGSGEPIDCVLKSYATGLSVNQAYNVDSAIALQA